MIKATKLFNENMTADEARTVFFREYYKSETEQDLRELKAAYLAVSSVLLRTDLEKAWNNREMD